MCWHDRLGCSAPLCSVERNDSKPSPKTSESTAPKTPTKKQQTTLPKPSGEATSSGVKKGGQAGGKKVTKTTNKQVSAPPPKQTTRTATRGNGEYTCQYWE